MTAIELTGAKRELHIRDTTQVDPASMFKLYYAGLAFERIELGKWQLSTKLSSENSVKTCLRLMISFSDNECASDFRTKLGISSINKRLLSWGLSSSHIVTNSRGQYLTKHTTTGDLAHFLKELHAGNILNANNTSGLIDLMKNQVWRGRISSGIQLGIQVASKSGQLLTNNGMIEADSALVYSPSSTYLLVVVGTSGATGVAVRGVSKLVYESWQGPITSRAIYPKAQLIVAKKTYLRNHAGGRILKTLAAGSALELLWSERSWLYVVSGSTKGFVYENAVRLSNRYLHWGDL